MPPGPRDRLVASAITLVRQYGVAGTGIAELVKHSGAARRSIYQHFPRGKSDLVAEATRVAGDAMAGLVEGFAAAGTPAQSLTAFVAAWRTTLADSCYTWGCPVVAAALGRADSPEAADAAAAAFQRWEGLLAAHLERAGVAPQAALSLATTTVAAVEGAVVLSIAARSPEPLDRTAHHLAELLEAHTG